MNEIEAKLKELSNMLETVPNECKGDSINAQIQRRKFLKIRVYIHELESILTEIK